MRKQAGPVGDVSAGLQALWKSASAASRNRIDLGRRGGGEQIVGDLGAHGLASPAAQVHQRRLETRRIDRRGRHRLGRPGGDGAQLVSRCRLALRAARIPGARASAAAEPISEKNATTEMTRSTLRKLSHSSADMSVIDFSRSLPRRIEVTAGSQKRLVVFGVS